MLKQTETKNSVFEEGGERCIFSDVYILQNVYKKTSWFLHAQGANAQNILFRIYLGLEKLGLEHIDDD